MRRFTSLMEILLLLWAAPAIAEIEQSTVEQVRTHDERAQQLFVDGDYAGSLTLLREAQQLMPSTTRLYNMAMCQQRLGDLQGALALYRQFVEATDSDQSRRETASQHILRIVGQLSNVEQPTDEQLPLIDEQQLSPDVQQTTPDEQQQAAVDRQPSTVDQRPVTGERQSTTEEHGDSTPPVTDDLEEIGRRRLHRAAFFSLLGLTVATGTATIGLGAATLSRYDDFTSTYNDNPNWPRLQETGRQMALATNIMLGVTALSATVTLVLGLFTRWRSGSEPLTDQSWMPSLSGSVVSSESRSARNESCDACW